MTLKHMQFLPLYVCHLPIDSKLICKDVKLVRKRVSIQSTATYFIHSQF